MTQEDKGIEAIIYLQSQAGITETREHAAEEWAAMSHSDRYTTLQTYAAVKNSTMKVVKHALDKDEEDLVLDVADGIIGTVRVCTHLVQLGHKATVEKMRDLGIRGSTVWIAYKDLGDETYETLVANIESSDIMQRLAALPRYA